MKDLDKKLTIEGLSQTNTKWGTWTLFLGTIAGALVGYSIGHFAVLNAHVDTTGFLQFLFNHIPGFSGDGFSRIQALY